jgi:hypothetical protein
VRRVNLRTCPSQAVDSLSFAAGCEAALETTFIELSSSAPASPPDVRRGSALPVPLKTGLGLGPWFGLWPITVRAEPEPGAQPILNYIVGGGAEPRLTSGGKAGA